MSQIYTLTDRGFKYLDPIAGRDKGDLVQIYESSAADEPCIRLRVDSQTGEPGHQSVHLTLEQAQQVADQLDWLIANHYQVDHD